MDTQADEIRERLPASKPVWITGLILGIIGWGGLALLIFLTLPTLGPRWLLFFLATLAFSGPALPVVRYLHKRFPQKPAATMSILVRESLWVGIYADLLIWLQFGKALNFALIVIIAACLFAIEGLLRLRERSQWTPPPAV